jgi:hypothetical protein
MGTLLVMDDVSPDGVAMTLHAPDPVRAEASWAS